MWLKEMMVKQVNHLPMTTGKQELQNNVSKLGHNPLLNIAFHFLCHNHESTTTCIFFSFSN